MPEHLWGYEYIAEAYKEAPAQSKERVVQQIIKNLAQSQILWDKGFLT